MIRAVFCADIGTSSLKAALISTEGKAIARTTAAFDSKKESDRWLFSLKTTFASLKKDVEDKGILEIPAIAISGNGPSLANSAGSFLWNEPLREGEIAAEVSAMAPSMSMFLPRLLHIKHEKKEMWLTDEPVLPVPEWVVYQLTGTAQTVLPDIRYKKAYWTDEDLRDFGISEKKVARFAPIGKSAGRIKRDIAIEMNMVGSDCPDDKLPLVFCGGPDFTIALIGTNTLTPGLVCDRAGTSEGINLCTREPLIAPGIRTLPSPVPPYWNASVLIPDSGLRFSKWRYDNLYADIPYDETVKWLLEHEDNDGFTLLLDIAFGVRKEMARLFKAAEEHGISLPKTITCTGGQAWCAPWMQMKADITGIPYTVADCADSELSGNAAIAMFGMEEYTSVSSAATAMMTHQTIYFPDKDRQKHYIDVYKKFKGL